MEEAQEQQTTWADHVHRIPPSRTSREDGAPYFLSSTLKQKTGWATPPPNAIMRNYCSCRVSRYDVRWARHPMPG